MNCIFARRYKDAIRDLNDAKHKYGQSYVMEHSYDFYIALSYLQLNAFEKAEQIFEHDINSMLNKKGKEWLHPLELFYWGITLMEQKKYNEAIEKMNNALELYPKFSEALHYKSNCLKKIGQNDQATLLKEQAKKYGIQGYTINDDNVIHVKYPYQIFWQFMN